MYRRWQNKPVVPGFSYNIHCTVLGYTPRFPSYFFVQVGYCVQHNWCWHRHYVTLHPLLCSTHSYVKQSFEATPSCFCDIMIQSYFCHTVLLYWCCEDKAMISKCIWYFSHSCFILQHTCHQALALCWFTAKDSLVHDNVCVWYRYHICLTIEESIYTTYRSVNISFCFAFARPVEYSIRVH